MSDPYGAYPSAPQPPQGWQSPQAERGPRPSTVNGAFGLMMLRCLLSVVSIIVTIAQKDEIKRKILDKTPDASKSVLDAAITVGIVFGVVFLALYAALAFQVRAGKNWARIVTWVLAGLGVLSLLIAFSQATVPAERAVSIISGLADIGIIVLLALAPSNAYFKGRDRYR